MLLRWWRSRLGWRRSSSSKLAGFWPGGEVQKCKPNWALGDSRYRCRHRFFIRLAMPLCEDTISGSGEGCVVLIVEMLWGRQDRDGGLWRGVGRVGESIKYERNSAPPSNSTTREITRA